MDNIPIWESNGIRGRGEKAPGCAGNYSGTAVILGGARCIWEDCARIDFEKVQVIAINNMIMHHKGRVHHGVSLHPQEPPLWRQLRWTNQCEESYVVTHSHRLPSHIAHPTAHYDEFKTEHGLDYLWHIEGGLGGSSGLFACMVGLALGYDRIVLAGIPLDESGHFFDPPEAKLRQFLGRNIDEEWLNADKNYFKGRVRALSGRPREWFGNGNEWTK